MANGTMNGRLLIAVIGALFILVQSLVGYVVMDIRGDVKDTAQNIKEVRSSLAILQETTVRRTLIDSVDIVAIKYRLDDLEDNP